MYSVECLIGALNGLVVECSLSADTHRTTIFKNKLAKEICTEILPNSQTPLQFSIPSIHSPQLPKNCQSSHQGEACNKFTNAVDIHDD
jgi:hypothetical protein